jgi:hypothetical protein
MELTSTGRHDSQVRPIFSTQLPPTQDVHDGNFRSTSAASEYNCRTPKGVAEMSTERHALSPLAALRQFFMADHVPYGLSLARIFLPLAALMPMVYRLPHVRRLFSTDGAPQPLFELFGQPCPIPIPSAPVAIALYALMVFALVCGSIGWRTRLSFMIGVPLYIAFNLLDAVGTMTKYSVIASHLLIMLTLSDCGAMWSVDAAVRRRRNPGSTSPPLVPIWPARLMQLLFCFVYFGAAITKIQTTSFFSGEQMRYWMLSNWNYANPVGEIMAMWTPLLLVSAYITVVWEILFGFLVWRPVGRYFALGLGAAFHFMTWVTLGLIVFPTICLSGYLSFVTEADVVLRQTLPGAVAFRVRAQLAALRASCQSGRSMAVLRPRDSWLGRSSRRCHCSLHRSGISP